MRLVNSKQFIPDPLYGDQPELLHGSDAVEGDGHVRGVDFEHAPIGSTYWYSVTDNHVQLMLKVKNDGRDDDWVVIQGVISERVTKADFTDGGSTAGTYTSAEEIPVGAYVDFANITNITAFSGDTSAALTIGDGDDPDRYNTSTVNVFATADTVAAGVVSGTRHHAAAKSPVLTITSASDFGDVAATGALTYSIFYRK